MIELGVPPPLLQARASANQTLSATAGTWTPVTLDVEDVDDDNGHSTTTNSARWSPVRTRRCRVSGAVIFNQSQAVTSGTTLRALRVVKNGTPVPGCAAYATYAANFLTLLTPSVLVSVGPGDYLELQAYAALASAALFSGTDAGSLLSVTAA